MWDAYNLVLAFDEIMGQLKATLKQGQDCFKKSKEESMKLVTQLKEELVKMSNQILGLNQQIGQLESKLAKAFT